MMQPDSWTVFPPEFGPEVRWNLQVYGRGNRHMNPHITVWAEEFLGVTYRKQGPQRRQLLIGDSCIFEIRDVARYTLKAYSSLMLSEHGEHLLGQDSWDICGLWVFEQEVHISML